MRDISERCGRPLDEIYVWIDFASIPQKCKPVQRLLVYSLPCIASAVDVFLVAAPRATHAVLVPGADARFTAPLDEQLSNPRKLGRPRLFRQRTSSRPPDDGDAMTAASSFAPSSQRSSGRIVTDADSSPEKVVGLEERRSKRSAVVRLASAPLLDVADEPLSP